MKRLIILFTTLLIALTASAASEKGDYVVRTDTAVRIGRLPNGLTYYIRHNDYQPNRAEFRLAHKVGSILETPSQRGLAHFLEHMAFNGTTHFPGMSLREFFQKKGIGWNASTDVEQTVYELFNVPIDGSSIVDTCLLVLRDWSDGLLLQDSMVEKERPIIVEEWRLRSNHGRRSLGKLMPLAFGSDKYADSDAIGSMEVVRNADSDDLRSYYEKWYRPDLQAVIVVGDIDPDYVEDKIKSTFADCELNPDAAERIWYPVTDNKEPNIFFYADKENVSGELSFMQKHDVYPVDGKNKFSYQKLKYLKAITSYLMNLRLEELTMALDAPFVKSGFYDGEFIFSSTKDAYTIQATCNERELERCFAAVFEEYERLRRYGFTESELSYAKKIARASADNAYDGRNSRLNAAYTNECLAAFQKGEPLVSPEDYRDLIAGLDESVTLRELNDFVINSDTTNMVIAFSGPESDSYKFPEKERIEFLMDSIRSSQLKPYAGGIADKPLISKKIRDGKIKAKRHRGEIIEYELSNGARVLYKPSELHGNHMLMTAYGDGGMCSESFDDAPTFGIIDEIGMVGGFGDFSVIDLNKYLAPMDVSFDTNLSVYGKELSGNSSEKDFETLLQMTYLAFTDLRRDDEAYMAFKQRKIAGLRNYASDPANIFRDSVMKLMMKSHPYALEPTAESVERADYGKGLEIMRRHFSRAADFNFVFTGSVDTLEFESLIKKYIASIPSKGKKDVLVDCGYAPAEGKKKIRYEVPAEIPKVSVFISFSGEMDLNLDNYVRSKALNWILRKICFKEMREKSGGIYDFNKFNFDFLLLYPADFFNAQIYYDCDPGKLESLLPVVSAELEKLSQEGPSQELLDAAKEILTNTYKEQILTDDHWLNVMLLRDVRDRNIYDGFEEAVRSLTIDDIRSFAKTMKEMPNYKEVVQIGVK